MTEVEQALLKQKLEDFDQQLKRIISHIESERRGQVETGKRVDQVATTMRQVIEMVNKHDSALFNGGRGGLIIDVDRLKNERDNKQRQFTLWLSIAGNLIAIISLYFTLR